jgi:hypothetical protein
MPHLISNLVEKAYTPFTAKLAPKHLWSKPTLGRKPQKVSRFGADPTVKATWRFIRRWVAQNHKLYYTYVLLCKRNSRRISLFIFCYVDVNNSSYRLFCCLSILVVHLRRLL